MEYLIDTNVVSEIMRKQPTSAVFDWFSQLETIYMSVVTLDEIVFGLSRKHLVRKLAWFQQFSSDKAVFLPISETVAKWSGEKRAELARRGIVMTMADSLIAATAHENGLVLATRNIRDFEHTNIAVHNPF